MTLTVKTTTQGHFLSCRKRFINKCSAKSSFWTCVRSISQNSAKQLYHQELVLRFFAFKNYRDKYVHDIGPFLDKYLEGVSRVGDLQLAFDYEQERAVFDKTFRLLAEASGENTFRASSHSTGAGAFRSLLYEAISIGIQDLLPHFDAKDSEHIQLLSTALNQLKKDQEFQSLTTGGGKNTLLQLNNRIDKVREVMHEQFSPVFQVTPFKRSTSTKQVKQKKSKRRK